MVVPRRFDFNPNEPMVADLQPMPTYYPGVLSLEQAQPITVERGMSITGLDVMALEGVSSVVSGMAIDPSGQPVRANGSIMARTVTEATGFNGGPVGNGPIKTDGTFQIKLPPGEYQLEARGSWPQQQPGDAPLVGSARVSVAGDISGLAIVMGGGARISGRLVFEGANEPPPFPTTNAGPMRVTFGSPDGSLCQAGRSTLAPDWTFTVESVTGTCRAQFAGNIPKWTVKAIMHDGKDLLDRPVTFETGQQWKDVEIVLTDKRTELTLQVADDQGAPTRDYVALVFSADKTRWEDPGLQIRTAVHPAADIDWRRRHDGDVWDAVRSTASLAHGQHLIHDDDRSRAGRIDNPTPSPACRRASTTSSRSTTSTARACAIRTRSSSCRAARRASR